MSKALVKGSSGTMLEKVQSNIVNQKALLSFVASNLKDGVDFDYPYEKAKKKNILKPGCEKITNYLAHKAVFLQVEDTEVDGMVSLECYLMAKKAMPIAYRMMQENGFDQERRVYRMLCTTMGFGAAEVSESVVGTLNVAWKKAAIRAHKDAILRLGLSDHFVQDAGSGGDDEDTDTIPHSAPSFPKSEPKKAAPQKVNEGAVADLYREAKRLVAEKAKGQVARDRLTATIDSAYGKGSVEILQAVINGLRNSKEGRA